MLFVLTLCSQSVIRAQERPASSDAANGEILKRWLEVQAANLNLRYRFVDNSNGITTTSQLQHREALRGRVKADAKGNYALNFGLFTGVRFTSGWDNTPWGIADAQK